MLPALAASVALSAALQGDPPAPSDAHSRLTARKLEEPRREAETGKLRAEEAAMLAALDSAKLARAQVLPVTANPFAALPDVEVERAPATPVPPPPAKLKPIAVTSVEAPPPPPAPPALPFRYVGRIAEAGVGERLFIAKGNAGFVVSVGDVIEGTYRVAEIGARELVFVYLPLEARQTLVIQ